MECEENFDPLRIAQFLNTWNLPKNSFWNSRMNDISIIPHYIKNLFCYQGPNIINYFYGVVNFLNEAR